MIKKTREIHGHAGKRSRTVEYNTWSAMIQRCNKPVGKSSAYAGVTVCARWRESFAAFLEDMGTRPSSRHSIDRKNNKRGYEPENCRWATREDQALNRRMSLRDGSVPLKHIAEQTGLPYRTLRDRFARGDRGAVLARPLDSFEIRTAKNSRTRLSKDDAETIRILYASGTLKQSEIAKTFGVHRNYISMVVSGRRWPESKPSR